MERGRDRFNVEWTSRMPIYSKLFFFTLRIPHTNLPNSHCRHKSLCVCTARHETNKSEVILHERWRANGKESCLPYVARGDNDENGDDDDGDDVAGHIVGLA